MLSNVFLKSLRDERWPMVWWSAGLGLFAAMMIAFFPSIRGNDDFNVMLESYPENLETLFGLSELTDITSAVGFFNAEIFGFMAPLLFVICWTAVLRSLYSTICLQGLEHIWTVLILN